MQFFSTNQTTELRDREACWQDYDQLRATSKYPSPSIWEMELTAASFCRRYLSNNVRNNDLKCKLCVVTGVCPDSAAFYVAQELAISVGMHVVLAGRSLGNLKQCQEAIQGQDPLRFERKLVLYTTKYHLASLESIQTAAEYVELLANKRYNGHVHVLVNMAHVGSQQAKLTKDGLEYNTGCNFVGTHYFTQLLLPLLPPHKGCVIQACSMGHCLGTNFHPTSFTESPQQGGAPSGFIVTQQHESVPETALLASPETIQVNEPQPESSSWSPYTNQDHLRAVQKSGTQVGRSKMALLADTFHMARLHAEKHISFFAFHLLPPAITGSFWGWSCSNEQAAFAALRAVLDEQLQTNGECLYLHSDGNPWTPMEPAQDVAFARACYESAETVLHRYAPRRIASNFERIAEQADYEPPQLNN